MIAVGMPPESDVTNGVLQPVVRFDWFGLHEAWLTVVWKENRILDLLSRHHTP